MTQNSTSSHISSRKPVKSTNTKPQQAQERASSFTKSSLLNNLQDIAKESAEIQHELPKQPDGRNIQKEIEALDKKQRIWLWLYRGWLLWKMWQDIPMSMIQHPEAFEGFLPPKFLSPFFVYPFALFVISPYLIQLWGMHKENLKAIKISLKIHWMYFWMAVLQVVVIILTLVKFEAFKALVTPYLVKFLGGQIEFPSREDYTVLALYTIGQSFFHYLVTLGGGILYKNYLIKRQRLVKEKSD